MNVRVLTVCGSIQPLSANRAAIDVAHSYLRSRRDVELDDYADLARIPPFNAAVDDPGPVVTAARLELVRTVVATAGVDIGRIAPPTSRP